MQKTIIDTPEGIHALSFDLDNYRQKTYLTHNFHPYPAKFVPQIPKELIQKLSNEGEWVLAPSATPKQTHTIWEREYRNAWRV